MPEHDSLVRDAFKIKGLPSGVFKKSSLPAGTANSLEPLSWSPDGRWLLVALGNWDYGSDAGGVSVLLYDNATHRIIVPDLDVMLRSVFKKDCWTQISTPFTFDDSSQIHLQLSDKVDEGDNAPATHCFKGREEWFLNPRRGTIHEK